MSETKNLKLFKHNEPLETNENKFDIDLALNQNWDKIEEFAEMVNDKIIEIEDKDEEQDFNLQELQNEIKKDRENMINLETEGQSIHVEDSSDLEGKLEVLGNVEQQTNLYTGKLEQGTINQEGEVSTTNRVRTVDFIKVTSGIKIPVRVTGADKFAFATYDNNKKFTSIIGTWTNVGESIVIPSNVNYIKIILGKNNDSNIAVSDITNFVVGNLPSPEYPSEIRAVGDNVNLLNWGENIIKNIAWKDTGESYTSENTNGTPNFIKIINTITISYNGKVAPGNLGRFNTYDKDKKIVATELITKLPYTKKFNSNEKYYTFHLVSPYVTYGSELKLELGEVPTSYSKFGQGSVEIKKQNKNLLKNTAKTQTVNGVTFTVNEDGTVIANGTATNVSYINVNTFPFIKNNDYVLSGCPDGGSDNSYKMDCLDSANIGGVGLTSDFGNGGIIKTGKDLIGIIRIRIASGYKADNLIFKPQLEKGTVKTEYVEHQEQTKILPIQKPMLKIGNTRDIFIKKEGKWYERHFIHKVIFNGTESWAYNKSGGNFAYRQIDNNTQYGKNNEILAISNYLKPSTFNNYNKTDNIVFAWSTEPYICIKATNSIASAETTKVWIKKLYDSGNPLIIYRTLITPTDLLCTPEQTKILDELDNFQTYKPVTNITTDSIAKLKLKYIADTKTYVDNKTSNLEQQVNTINQLLSTTKTSSILLDNLQKDIERPTIKSQ